MSMKLNVSSGSYNVRESELYKGICPPGKLIRCRVHFLDDSEGNFEIDKHSKGQVLLDKVFEYLELIEKDYFGLQYVEHTPTERLVQWLDPSKMIRRQIHDNPPFLFYFRVKFYVSEPSKLKEEYTRYHVFLQLKKDILDGRLVPPLHNAAVLASYAAQSELGDYSPDEHTHGYLSVFRFIPHQTEDFEQIVCEHHQQHRGQMPADAEYHYLEHAKRLDMYGAHLYQAQLKDKSGLVMQLGVTAVGLIVFQNNARVNAFSWSKIVKISFKRNQFFIQMRREPMDTTENLVGFNMTSYRQCKNLWKVCVEHHTFFRLHAPPPPRPSLFSFQSKFRYSGRTEYETLEEVKRKAKIARTFTRSPSKRYARRTVGACTSRDVMLDRRRSTPLLDGYAGSSVNQSVDSYSQRSASDGQNSVTSSTYSVSRQPVNSWSSHRTNNSTGFAASPPNSSDSITKSVNPALRSTLPADYKPSGYGTASRTNIRSNSSSTNSVGGENQPRAARSPATGSESSQTDHRITKSVDQNYGSLTRRRSRGYDSSRVNGSDRRSSRNYEPRVTPDQSSDWESGEFYLSSAASTMQNSVQNYLSHELPQIDALTSDLNLNSGIMNGNGSNFVTIRMKPDAQGRFGFNVKGGADQGLPVIVSKVAAHTPADLCIPRLNEGDQVLFINGRDISSLTHEQVVQTCRNLREVRGGELVLIVRPNVYIAEDLPDDSDVQYVPEPQSTPTLQPGGDLLARSLQQLQDGLDSGTVMKQFEQLYRKKPGMTMDAARFTENLPKNRYRDISPYDQTRVKLRGGDGDYINANFVNMEIARSGIVNRYIAAQGPLPVTTADFWLMVWEQRSSLIVMLTTESERGRVKCHQYWPEPYAGATRYGNFAVTAVKEEITPRFAFRDFTVSSGKEERIVKQMQYMAWPDHGVPDDSSDFLDFVVRVRKCRTGMVEPTVVHCSAGIGRTGVLITMETAMCQIEANEPVFPLNVVRQMREQRAMLIQTASQFRFVCEAILRVYNDKVVVPLNEYK